MGWDEREDRMIYRVVVNIEEQYSIWPVDRELALGWTDTGKRGSKTEVLAWIDVVWSVDERRPLSLRKKMEEHGLEDTRAYQAILDLYTGRYYHWLLEREVPVGFRGTGKTGSWEEVSDWIRQMPVPMHEKFVQVAVGETDLYRAIYTSSSPAYDGTVYVLWPVNRELPSDYHDTGRVGPKLEVLAWIMEVWHQPLPLEDTQPYQAVIGPGPASKYLAWPKSTAVSYPFRSAICELRRLEAGSYRVGPAEEWWMSFLG